MSGALMARSDLVLTPTCQALDHSSVLLECDPAAGSNWRNLWRRKTMWYRWFWICLLILSYSAAVRAQSDVPTISGGVGFFDNKEGGSNSFLPVIAPVVLVPLGDRWLIESRSNFTEVFNRQDGTTGPYQGQFFGTLEYLQVDYNVTSALTLTAGRFLTPFGSFNER